jgi:hypothetical protein
MLNTVQKGGGIAKAGAIMQEYNEAAFEEFDTKALIPCNACGRTFLPAALNHHAKSCKPGKVLKRRYTGLRND